MTLEPRSFYRLIGGWWMALAVAAVIASRAAPSPRSLPSLVTDWRWDGDAEMMAAAGDEIVVLGGRLAVLDRQSGEIVAEHQLRVFRLAGPPPVARIYHGEQQQELVAVDAGGGGIRARWRTAASFGGLAAQSGRVVVAVDPGRAGEPSFLAGFDADLELRWRLPVNRYTFFEEWRGEILLRTHDPDDVRRFYPLDVLAGELREPLPRRQASDVSGGLDWEYQIVEISDHDASVTLRRNDPESGRPLWLLDLPGHPSVWAVAGDRIVLHCEAWAGRGLLVVVDRHRGEILTTAYGLREVDDGHLDGERWILLHDGAVTAVRLDRFGAPESQLRPIAAEVARILDRLEEGDGDHFEITAAAAELQALGPAALPAAAELLADAEGPRLSALAALVAAADHAPAVSPLVEHLRAFVDDPPPADDEYRVRPASAVLDALTEIAGPSEARLLARLLRDPGLAAAPWIDAERRWRVLAALGRVAAETAGRVVDELRAATPPPSEPWWEPPGGGLLELAGSAALGREIRRAEEARDWETLHELEEAARGAVLETASEASWVVFPDGRYGGPNDLWLAVPAEDRGEPAVFFVGSLATDGDDRPSGCAKLRARLEHGRLEVSCEDEGFPTLRRDLDELARDSDGDGLTDLLEEKLRLDPRRADSDGDGEGDAVDLAPNAIDGAPRGDEELIVHAIFEQFFLLSPDSDGLAVVEADRALEWSGRRGPTLTLAAEDAAEFRRRAGFHGIVYVDIVAVSDQDPEAEDFWGRPDLRPGERRYGLSLYRGPLNAVGYTVVVKSAGDRWVITRLEMAWIS